MKHILLIIAVSTLSLNGNAQIKGVDFSEAKYSDMYSYDKGYIDGEFVVSDHESGPAYSFAYTLSPVGYKHCIEKLDEILTANGGARLPDIDHSLIPSYIENEYGEFEAMSFAIQDGTAEVKMVWHINEWDIFFSSAPPLIGLYIIERK